VPGLSWLFDPPSFPQAGATGVVRVASPGFGQSMRFIVDWGAPDEATLVVPFGVSEHAGSRHRLDQLSFWRDGDPSGAATRLSRPARETAGFVP
jgi:acyl-homoserine lactone acylase PvdQ